MCQLPPDSHCARRFQVRLSAASADVVVAATVPATRAPTATLDETMRTQRRATGRSRVTRVVTANIPSDACEVSCRVRARRCPAAFAATPRGDEHGLPRLRGTCGSPTSALVVLSTMGLDRPGGTRRAGRDSDARVRQQRRHAKSTGVSLTTQCDKDDRDHEAPAWLRDFSRLAMAVAISTTMITPRLSSVLICGTCKGSPPLMNGSSFSCSACRTSFTPMNARMNDSPSERYTSLRSMSPSRKYSWRRPIKANRSEEHTSELQSRGHL